MLDPFAFQQEEKQFTPSPYQQAIFDFVAQSTGHGICEACAGSGKTTTNIEALEYVPAGIDVVFLAFNRHIANELKSRSVDCASTFHSLGRAAIVSSMPIAKFNQYKIYDICDEVEVGLSYDDKAQIAKIVGLLKGNLLDCDIETVFELIEDYSIGNVDDVDWLARTVCRVFAASKKNTTEYDFDDMIYWPATGKVSCRKFDFIFVDEAQDLNKAQIEFAQRSLNSGGRMLLIGDPWQAIYQFRGAFVGIMDYMSRRLKATHLPLSISYRAPLTVVELVNREFPHIPFEPFEKAKPGSIETINSDQFLQQVKAGDGIICRCNAPLVEPCFTLIRRGIKATILGRDIGNGLISLIDKRAKLAQLNYQDARMKSVEYAEREKLYNLIDELRLYFTNEKAKLEKAKKFGIIQSLEDQIETIIAISDDCGSIKQLKDKINSTFSDNSAGIVFSSVHKAKGLEWDTVYILEPDLMPHPMAKTPESRQQELNIKYVAITRTKDKLYFVRSQ